MRYIIGIDPGTKTGIAVYDTQQGKLINVITTDIIRAIEIVKQYKPCFVNIEDPNARTWFGDSGREKLQGAGSVKRDYAIWRDELTRQKIPFKGYAPKDCKAYPLVVVKRFWQGRTSEHSRVAITLAFKKVLK